MKVISIFLITFTVLSVSFGSAEKLNGNDETPLEITMDYQTFKRIQEAIGIAEKSINLDEYSISYVSLGSRRAVVFRHKEKLKSKHGRIVNPRAFEVEFDDNNSVIRSGVSR